MSGALLKTIVALYVFVTCWSAALDAQTTTTTGWILWNKNVTWYPATDTKVATTTTQWSPVDGYDALSECRAEGQRQVLIFLEITKHLKSARLVGSVTPDGRSATFNSKNDERFDVAYVCFPGTFDPRPR